VQIPDWLDIDGLRWEVTIGELGDHHGETRCEDCKVHIASRLTQQVREQTFWHELIHACFASRDLCCGNDNRKFSEEEVASLLGAALHSVFERNATIEWRDHGEEEEDSAG
jgi:hypothetical protein